MAGMSRVASESMKQEARRPETAVAEAGLLLLLDQRFKIEAELAHGLLGFVVDAEVDEVVGEVRPGEKLGGEIADHAHILRAIISDGLRSSARPGGRARCAPGPCRDR